MRSNDARDVIAKKSYSAEDDDIRRFRQDARKLLRKKSWKNITEFYDYYFLNECCDLPIPCAEIQFTPLMIADHLQRLGLGFRRLLPSVENDGNV